MILYDKNDIVTQYLQDNIGIAPNFDTLGLHAKSRHNS